MTKKKLPAGRAGDLITVTVTATFVLEPGVSLSDITECVESCLSELRTQGEAKAVMEIPAMCMEIV